MSDQQRLQQLERAVKRMTRWSLILQVVFVLLVGGAAGYLYWQARIYLDADVLVARAEERLKEDYPQIRRDIKVQVEKTAPSVAEKASNRTLALIPQGRGWLEEMLLRETEAGLNRGTALSREEFRRFVRENRTTLQKAFEDLRQTPEKATQLATELEKALDKYLGTDIYQDIQVVLEVLTRLNDKLQLLVHGDKLTRSELVEQRIVRILRALQMRGPPKPAGDSKE